MDLCLYHFSNEQSMSDKWENGTILTIIKVNAKHHQGNYTCAPSTLTPSSVIVHIMDEGKMPQDAAVYDSFDSSSSRSLISHFLPSNILILRCITKLMVYFSLRLWNHVQESFYRWRSMEWIAFIVGEWHNSNLKFSKTWIAILRKFTTIKG